MVEYLTGRVAEQVTARARGERGLTSDPKSQAEGVYSASGVYGDPTLASVEKGEAIVEAMIQYIVDDVKKLVLL
jgi:creatinine amidohydrolase/Fe(II)-dependent formamide hydrolase-like protein